MFPQVFESEEGMSDERLRPIEKHATGGRANDVSGIHVQVSEGCGDACLFQNRESVFHCCGQRTKLLAGEGRGAAFWFGVPWRRLWFGKKVPPGPRAPRCADRGRRDRETASSCRANGFAIPQGPRPLLPKRQARSIRGEVVPRPPGQASRSTHAAWR